MNQVESVSSLLLDESNPRFTQPVTGQDEAITELLKQFGQKIIHLAADIVEQGAVNPTELMMAVEADGALTVIEGNRRLAALKLLRDPELARAASNSLDRDLVGEFTALANVGVGPNFVDVWVAESRDAAKHWLELRHTGENGGVGVVEWDALQANSFRRRPGSQADRADLFCRAVEAEFPQEIELLRDVEAVRRSRLTTLGRLVGDPRVRAQFGFDFQGDSVVFEYSTDVMLRGIARIFSDLANGDVTVTDIKTKDNRRVYVKERTEALPHNSQRLPVPRTIGDDDEASQISDVEPQESPDSIPTKQKSRAPRRERVIFEGMRLPNVADRIRRLLKEAQSVDIDDSPQVAGILIRIIMELVVTDCIERGVVPGKEDDPLKKKIRRALLVLDPSCENARNRNKELTMAWTRTQDPDGMALQSLHAYVHNRYGSPTPSEVRDLSDGFRPMIEQLDALIGAGRP